MLNLLPLCSIVIPVRNEERLIDRTLSNIHNTLAGKNIPVEYVIVNDNSSDRTEEIVREAGERLSLDLKIVRRKPPAGFGRAVNDGLLNATGDNIILVMADGSDAPDDIVRYYEKLNEGYDCVFGSRFMRGAKVTNYPIVKYLLNRIANHLIQLLFLTKLNDTTNAFKAYKREVIEAIKPIVSVTYNITVELPLKAIVRGAKYAIIPISWTGERETKSYFDIKEMGSRYFFVILDVFLERLLVRNKE